MIKPKTISSLIIASALMANIAIADGVSTNKDALETPTLTTDNSAYKLIEGNTTNFVVTKYLDEADANFTFSPVYYNLGINNPLGDSDGTSYYFRWFIDGNGNRYLNTISENEITPDKDIDIEIEVDGNKQEIIGSGTTHETINHSFNALGDANKGGAISNAGNVAGINGDFVSNKITTEVINIVGGAISNTGVIGDINSHFLGNAVESNKQAVRGGAICNIGKLDNSNERDEALGVIGDITGDFIGNYTSSNAEVGSTSSGAIYNAEAEIGNITGDFIGNYTVSFEYKKPLPNGSFLSKGSYALGGAIFSRDYSKIGNITGDFIENYAKTTSGSREAKGGAIYNLNNSKIGSITGDFIENYAYSNFDHAQGGAINNNKRTEIGDITGSFIGNYAHSNNGSEIESNDGQTIGTAQGGAVYNYEYSKIGNITGDFIGNYASSTNNTANKQNYIQGGAIYNYSNSTIGNITGDFIGNYIDSINDDAEAVGGAIYNQTSTIGNIEGSFIGNYISVGANKKAKTYTIGGAAIYNQGGTIALLAKNKDVIFEGNYIDQTDFNGDFDLKEDRKFEDIFNCNGGKLYMNAYDDKKIVVNGAIENSNTDGNRNEIHINSGYSGYSNDTKEFIAIDGVEGKEYGVVQFNNSINQQHITVHAGTLILGEYEGRTLTVKGVDNDDDGKDDSITTVDDSAMLKDTIVKQDSDSGTTSETTSSGNTSLTINEGAIVQTSAGYLGSDKIEITNEGILEFNGGILNTLVGGNGVIKTLENKTLNTSIANLGNNNIINNGTLAINTSGILNTVVRGNGTIETLEGTRLNTSMTNLGNNNIINNGTLAINTGGTLNTVVGGNGTIETLENTTLNTSIANIGNNNIINNGTLAINTGGTLNTNIEGKGVVALTAPITLNSTIKTTSIEICAESLWKAPAIKLGDNGAIIDANNELPSNPKFTVSLGSDFEADINDIFWLLDGGDDTVIDNDSLEDYVVEVLFWNDVKLTEGVDYDKHVDLDHENQLGIIFNKVISPSVPEPSTYAMILGALALAFAYYRKRK